MKNEKKKRKIQFDSENYLEKIKAGSHNLVDNL